MGECRVAGAGRWPVIRMKEGGGRPWVFMEWDVGEEGLEGVRRSRGASADVVLPLGGEYRGGYDVRIVAQGGCDIGSDLETREGEGEGEGAGAGAGACDDGTAGAVVGRLERGEVARGLERRRNGGCGVVRYRVRVKGGGGED